MEQQIDDIIKDIRKRCRMAMDGMISAKMREQGLIYKLNFGVSLMHIKDIAKRYEPSVELAEKIWQEDVRELKILATMLYPVTVYDQETADCWMKGVPNQEIREQLTINLLQKLDYAADLVLDWCLSDEEKVRISGYGLLARLLLLKNEEVSTDLQSYPFILSDVKSDNVSLRNSALQALKYLGRSSQALASAIMGQVGDYKTSDDTLENEIFNSLQFEFQYYFENH